MIAEPRIESLRERHATLDTAISQETQRPHPNESRIHELKREKLRIKDQIEGIIN